MGKPNILCDQMNGRILRSLNYAHHPYVYPPIHGHAGIMLSYAQGQLGEAEIALFMDFYTRCITNTNSDSHNSRGGSNCNRSNNNGGRSSTTAGPVNISSSSSSSSSLSELPSTKVQPSTHSLKPDVVLFLDAEPYTCHQRLVLREDTNCQVCALGPSYWRAFSHI